LKGKVAEAKEFVHKHHNVPKTYATQTVLAAQPTIVMAPMPVLAPQPETVIAPTAQLPPPIPPVMKTKTITLAGKHKSIIITKTTPVSVCSSLVRESVCALLSRKVGAVVVWFSFLEF
jgi:hypothetical protein